MKEKTPTAVKLAVLVAALGYFVDIFDIVLFGVLRQDSLTELGYIGTANGEMGLLLTNLQMIGMLVGGVLWGILGDKRGRISVLFGSILLYSTANIANGLINDIVSYGVCRFIAGLGLAGELGAGITLVSELMKKEKRGIGTMIVAAVGVSGAIAATAIGKTFDWRITYFIGGGLGLMLLALRVGVHESGMFKNIENTSMVRGSLKMLFSNKSRIKRYVSCLLMGMPAWFVVGVLIYQAPEFGESLGIEGDISAAIAIRNCYLGMTFGDFTSGAMSQLMRSRRNVLLLFFILTAIFMGFYLFLPFQSVDMLYLACGLLGFGVGFWAIFVTVAAELFGTNLRALSATTVPNFARGMMVPLSAIFVLLMEQLHDRIFAAVIVGGFSLILAFIGWSMLPETYGNDLDFIEE
jgi:MFS transporter, putative metabolite:H+ symporter